MASEDAREDVVRQRRCQLHCLLAITDLGFEIQVVLVKIFICNTVNPKNKFGAHDYKLTKL